MRDLHDWNPAEQTAEIKAAAFTASRHIVYTGPAMNSADIREWIENNARLSFARSGGPGGQYVNTSDTKVVLHIAISSIPLPEKQRERVLRVLENRINLAGELVVQSSETRSQVHNRELAFERVHRLILSALVPVKKRRPTRPSRASQEKRIRRKKSQGEKKRMRRPPSD